MKKIFLVLGIAGAIMGTGTGCNSTATSGSSNDTVAQADTIAEPLEPLPDTVLASAANVHFIVDVLDTVTPGTLSLDVESAYDPSAGVFTFRGNERRDMAQAGKVSGKPSRIEQDWVVETASDTTRTSLGVWGGGTGWTGQPLYVEKNQEIIVGSLCGKVYFLDFNTGASTREPLDVGNPVKGTTSLDPAMNGSLYVGQGVPARKPFGHLAVNLNAHRVEYMCDRDRKALRNWGAYDSSPVVAGGFLFWPGENGTLYKYAREGDGHLTMHSCLRYWVGASRIGAGMESSMCVYRNYGYMGDNHGHILCINLNTLKPVWHYWLGDDIDASLVLEVEDGVPYVYAGCEVDRQGPTGNCNLVRLNGIDGTEVWKRSIECNRLELNGKHFDGGLYSTPLLGHGDCEGMIFLNLCQRGTSRRAEFMALNRKTGETIYSVQLKSWAWSSPVPFYNEQNQLFVMTGDSAGHGYLIAGKTGEVLFTAPLIANFESSPVVKDNYAVVGSRGNKIYRFAIK